MRCVIACFFFNDTATTEIYTLSLHDALPISVCFQILQIIRRRQILHLMVNKYQRKNEHGKKQRVDRKSTRLNSSHANISYAVFCLKKKKMTPRTPARPYSAPY